MEVLVAKLEAPRAKLNAQGAKLDGLRARFVFVLSKVSDRNISV